MKNTVELIGHCGSDLAHACSAWTSTNRELTPDKIARVPALLKMLADAGHHTPFEKSMLHFLVRVDTATHIHLLKHRIGVSINGESARYKELKSPTFYVPDDWPEKVREEAQEFFMGCAKSYHDLLQSLEKTLGRKRAKESARFLLPYANQLTLDVSFNWRSFHHFLSLRAKPDAQKEIRDIAEEMLRLVAAIDGKPFKHTIAALGFLPNDEDQGRGATGTAAR